MPGFAPQSAAELKNDIDKLSAYIVGADKEHTRLQRERDDAECLNTQILPRELERLRNERDGENGIAPDDTVAQCLIQGQINEIRHLQGEPMRIDTAIAHVEREIESARMKIAKLQRKYERKVRGNG